MFVDIALQVSQFTCHVYTKRRLIMNEQRYKGSIQQIMFDETIRNMDMVIQVIFK